MCITGCLPRPGATSRRCLFVFLLAAVFSIGALSAQTTVPPFVPGDRLEIVVRSNYSVRRDGRYTGHVQRETRTWLVAGEEAGIGGKSGVGGKTGVQEGDANSARIYRGEFIATENTIRDLRTVASALTERADISVRYDGTRLVGVGGAPANQGIPTVPRTVTAAQGWEAPAVVRVSLPGGAVRSVPTVIAYRPKGYEVYQGAQVYQIEFGYSLRWPITPVRLEEHPAVGLFAVEDLPDGAVRISGNHQGVILLPSEGGVPVLHRTDIVEQIVSADGGAEERRGFFLTWYFGPAPPDDLLARLRRQEIDDVSVERDGHDRVRLSIRNLQFVADQAELLPGEGGRIDAITNLLRTAGEATILVTGHTADVGSRESQVELSIARARRIADELIARGIPPGRIRYEGRDGSDPVGDNSTDAGRAANRRVEITLLSE